MANRAPAGRSELRDTGAEPGAEALRAAVDRAPSADCRLAAVLLLSPEVTRPLEAEPEGEPPEPEEEEEEAGALTCTADSTPRKVLATLGLREPTEELAPELLPLPLLPLLPPDAAAAAEEEEEEEAAGACARVRAVMVALSTRVLAASPTLEGTEVRKERAVAATERVLSSRAGWLPELLPAELPELPLPPLLPALPRTGTETALLKLLAAAEPLPAAAAAEEAEAAAAAAAAELLMEFREPATMPAS